MSRMRSHVLTFSEVFDLPVVVDLRTAAKALGICVGTAYRLIHQDVFPCAVLRMGGHYRVPTASLMAALEVDEVPVYAADVESGTTYV